MSTPSPLFHGKHVLVFAATGAIGSATARLLAAHGAHVWLSARSKGGVDALVGEILSSGGRASGTTVDATDAEQVDGYVAAVAAEAGRIDGAFNAIGLPASIGGYPARNEDLDVETFLRPFRTIVASTFLTSRAAGARMAAQGSGAIVTLSASLSATQIPFMAALTAACGAVEALSRSLATDLAPAGVRVNNVRADAMPDTASIRDTGTGMAALGVPFDAFMAGVSASPLGRPTTTADTAGAVAYLLSDLAAATTYQNLNVSARAVAA